MRFSRGPRGAAAGRRNSFRSPQVGGIRCGRGGEVEFVAVGGGWVAVVAGAGGTRAAVGSARGGGMRCGLWGRSLGGVGGAVGGWNSLRSRWGGGIRCGRGGEVEFVVVRESAVCRGWRSV